jgi:hypothetical protein
MSLSFIEIGVPDYAMHNNLITPRKQDSLSFLHDAQNLPKSP